MSPKECLQQIVMGVQSDLAEYQQLKRLLNEQHNLLRRRDVRILSDLLTRQQELVNRLQKNANLRSELLAELGLNADDHGMSVLLERLPAPLVGRLSPQWRQLKDLVNQCKHQNDVNGRVLLTQYEVIKRMLYGEPNPDYSPMLPGNNAPY